MEKHSQDCLRDTLVNKKTAENKDFYERESFKMVPSFLINMCKFAQ